jgi:hypothetical protein
VPLVMLSHTKWDSPIKGFNISLLVFIVLFARMMKSQMFSRSADCTRFPNE